MSKKYDAEDILDMILSIMNNGLLNAKITAIEAEKAASNRTLVPGLLLVDEGSYYEQTWTNKILNTNPAIFYGIEDVAALDGGGVVAKTYKCFVEVILIDNGQTNDVARRIARYSRALEELFAAAFAPAASRGSIKIETVRPIAFKLDLDSDNEIKVGGISISISLV